MESHFLLDLHFPEQQEALLVQGVPATRQLHFLPKTRVVVHTPLQHKGWTNDPAGPHATFAPRALQPVGF